MSWFVKRIAGVMSGVILSLPLASREAPGDDLEQVTAQIAEQVAGAIRNSDAGTEATLQVGAIVSRSTGGPKARRALIQALKDHGVDLSSRSDIVIDGKVQPRAELTRGRSDPAAILALALEGPRVRKEFTGIVDEEQDIIALLGITGRLTVKEDRPTSALLAPIPGGSVAAAVNVQQRKDELSQLITSPPPPTLTPNPTPVIADDGRPELSEVHVGAYAIEILIKDENGPVHMADGTRYSPRPPRKSESGEVFVDIYPGEIYAVKLINDSTNYDTGVKLTIDGLDSFEFSEEAGYKKLEKWVIPAQSSGIVRGWHLRNEGQEMVSAEFEVAKYGEGLAEEMGVTEGVGTITATFRAAWHPDDETPQTMLAYAQPRGTRKGAEVQDQLSESRRLFGEIRAAISVRYQVAE